MDAVDYRLMSSFELIDRVNRTVSWDDEEIEYCMRELCDRYDIDFDNYNDEDESIWDYETLWDKIISDVYDDVVIHNNYSINNRDYVIVSLDSDDYPVFAVVDDVNHRVMFEVYEIGTMRECKDYIKERIDID